MRVGFRGKLLVASMIASLIAACGAGYTVLILGHATQRAQKSLIDLDEFEGNRGRALQMAAQTEELLWHLGMAQTDADVTKSSETITAMMQDLAEILQRMEKNPLVAAQPEHTLEGNIASAQEAIDPVRSLVASVATRSRQALLGDLTQRSELTTELHNGFSPLVNLRHVLGVMLAGSRELTRGIVEAGSAGLDRARFQVGIALGLTIVLMVLGGVLFARRVSEPLQESVDSLEESSRQLRDAAQQVSAVSQSLASSAAEQAASLEETTSSVKDISAMTNKNAQNAVSAKGLATETRQSAEQGRGMVGELVRAMEQIKGAADEIAKIIKVIDEIAFQTNMLALNAAVEAARAGELGMGFAVVAEEVRKLAQRCAQAAKDTETRIQESIRRTGAGVELTQRVSQSLEEMLLRVCKADELMGFIADASGRQAEGIDQTNAALSQIERATQQTASAAEEAAASADELIAQADGIERPIGHLRGILEGRSTRASVPRAQWRKPAAAGPRHSPAVAARSSARPASLGLVVGGSRAQPGEGRATTHPARGAREPQGEL